MCGIVGYVQNRFVDSDIDLRYRNALADLLYTDTLRGMDSTGVAVIPRNLAHAHYVLKRAVPGFTFIDLEEYKQVWARQNNPVIAIGHNRAATHGTVKDENAHPFVTDHITLVHNGTIRNMHQLDSGVQSGVDSAHIAGAIAKHGAKVALEKLDGACVAVWYDKKEHSMNIARTRDRGIRWIFDEHGTCWYASEREMLWSILIRNGIEPKTGFFSADEFTWYKWELPKNVTALEEKDMGKLTKEKFAEFVPQWKLDDIRRQAEAKERGEAGKSALGESNAHFGMRRAWTCKNTTDSSTGSTTSRIIRRREKPVSKSKIAKADKKLSEFELKTGDEITMKRTAMFTHKENQKMCDIHGIWTEKGVRVVLCDVPVSVWDRQPSGFYKVNVYTVLKEHIKEKGKHSPLIYAELKEYSIKDLVQGPGGNLIPRDEFVRLAGPGCAWCAKTPYVNDHELTEWVNGKPLCHTCSVNFGTDNRMLQ